LEEVAEGLKYFAQNKPQLQADGSEVQ